MGSAGRHHRRARSTKVSYKDSCSEDDEEEFSVARESVLSKPSENKDTARRNLALKRVSRSQERAEALQVQKAIEESLSQSKVDGNEGQVPLEAGSDSKEVNDSEEDVPNVPSNPTTGAGLPCLDTDPNQEESKGAPSMDCPQEQGIQIPPNQTVHEDDALAGQEVICKMDQSTNSKIAKARKKREDVDWSNEEDDTDDYDDDETETEDESSDSSEDIKGKRKGQAKSQRKGKKGAAVTGREQKPPTAPVKRPRSSRATSEAEAQLNSKKSVPSKDVAMKRLVHKRLDCKDEAHKLSSLEASKKHVMASRECKELGGKGVMLKGCKSALVDGRKLVPPSFKNAPILDNASCETPGILAFPAQSPTGLHRRVIGLSRRFKPPPLHPYLSRMEG